MERERELTKEAILNDLEEFMETLHVCLLLLCYEADRLNYNQQTAIKGVDRVFKKAYGLIKLLQDLEKERK